MKYYILYNDINDDDIWVDSYDVEEPFDFDCLSGKHLSQNQKGELFFNNGHKKETDYIAGIYSFPVVSERLKNLLGDFKSDPLEFFPVELIDKESGKIIDSYYILNILDNISAFNWSLSKYEERMPGGTPFGITHLVLDEKNLPPRKIVRIKEIPTIILISDDLYQEIKKQKISGIKVVNIEDYNEYDDLI